MRPCSRAARDRPSAPPCGLAPHTLDVKVAQFSPVVGGGMTRQRVDGLGLVQATAVAHRVVTVTAGQASGPYQFAVSAHRRVC